MAISKVVYNSNTLIDLTSDTVLPEHVAKGITFHLPNGQTATGTAIGLYNGTNPSVSGTVTNKVVYNGNTLIDLTSDTVTAAQVESGITFHLPNGHQATGTASNHYGRLLNNSGNYLCINDGKRIIAKIN